MGRCCLDPRWLAYSSAVPTCPPREENGTDNERDDDADEQRPAPGSRSIVLGEVVEQNARADRDERVTHPCEAFPPQRLNSRRNWVIHGSTIGAFLVPRSLRESPIGDGLPAIAQKGGSPWGVGSATDSALRVAPRRRHSYASTARAISASRTRM